MMNEDREMIESFVVESHEMLDEIEPFLIDLQNSIEGNEGFDSEILNSIFRLFHTIKGTSGFFQLKNLQNVTHEAETILDLYRKGKIELSQEHMQLLFKTIDFIRKILANIFEEEGYGSEAKELIEKFSKSSTPQEEKEEPAESTAKQSRKEKPAGKKDGEIQFKVDDDLIIRFVDESMEVLDGLDQNLIELENNPDEYELLDSAFRNIHTFKGNAGLMGYADLEKLSHRSENILDLMRNGARREFGPNLRLILKLVEVFRETLSRIKQGEEPEVTGIAGMLFLLDDTIDELKQDVPETESGKSGEPTAEQESESEPEPEPEKKPEVRQTAPKKELKRPPAPTEKPNPPALVKTTPAPKPPEKKPKVDKRELVPGQQKKAMTSTSIRIDLDKVDKLVDWVGELSIAELMVAQNPVLKSLDENELSIFEQATFDMRRIITEIQNISLSLRMLPIASTFKKMLRLIHDLSLKAGKKVRLNLVGEDTEVDKSVIDLISDPLVHIIRNSIDHGIEPPEERLEKGKPETGTINLEARHESGEVWISIQDDGRGLDEERIFAKAQERGLIPESATINEMSLNEIHNMIFMPGFSTAAKVTEISGRGVGMDVVKRNLEKIKGRIDIRSQKGKGTSIHLRIPLTMALIEGMLVQTGSKRFIIPLLAIREFFQPRKEDITRTMDGDEIVKIRDELIPIMRLHTRFDIQDGLRDLTEGILIICELGRENHCLYVDAILGQQKTVIKAIPNYYRQAEGISGFTILGDGNVCPILDLSILFNLDEV